MKLFTDPPPSGSSHTPPTQSSGNRHPGGPKGQKAEHVQGDRGYDSEPVRQLLRWLEITPVLAAR
jgi:hypothetical protein